VRQSCKALQTGKNKLLLRYAYLGLHERHAQAPPPGNGAGPGVSYLLNSAERITQAPPQDGRGQ
jgi:hypothetical protein